MADEFLSTQDEAVPPVPDTYLVFVSDPVDADHPYKIPIKNFFALTKIYLRKPDNSWLKIEATDDNQLQFTPLAVLP